MESIRRDPTTTDRYPSPIPRQLHPQVRDLISLMEKKGKEKKKEKKEKRQTEKEKETLNIFAHENNSATSTRLTTAVPTAAAATPSC
jgi:IMP dehydrogenase/GMP reductase